MRIFISACTRDLGSYRRAVADELRKLDVQAIEQNDFSADYLTIREMLREKIRQADAVICLVGPVCGEGSRDRPSFRSWTQMEYDFAEEFGKPIYVFFPDQDCLLDGPGQDTPERTLCQQQHIAALRAHQRKWDLFKDHGGIRSLAGQAVNQLRTVMEAGDLRRRVGRLPTPAAGMFADLFPDEQQRGIVSLATESVRWMALLATHDALTSRVFGAGMLDAPEHLKRLTSPMELQDWRMLLRAACPEERAEERFVPELAGWERRFSAVLDKITDGVRRLAQGRRLKESDFLELLRQLKEQISTLYGGIDFLERYVVLAVDSIDPSHPEKLTGRILRGQETRVTELTAARDAKADKAVGGVFLLSMDRCEALDLRPALRYLGERRNDDLWGLTELRLEDGRVEFEWDSFRDSDAVVKSGGPSDLPADETTGAPVEGGAADRGAALRMWLGVEDAASIGTHEGAPAKALRTCLIDEASWEQLRRRILPVEEQDLVLAGRYRLSNPPIHRGLHADLFEATHVADHDAEDPPFPLAHLLRIEQSEDPVVRRWFCARVAGWNRLRHPSVLPIYPRSNFTESATRPFLITDRLSNARSLQRRLDTDEPFDDARIRRIVATAAEICLEAHQRGLRLLAVPPRHLLVDEQDRIHMTGFETAVTTAQFDWQGAGSPREYLARFSRDWETVAPEVFRSKRPPAATADVFALGVLTARLLRRSTQPMQVLPAADWDCPWSRFLFHCLAADPNVRFQSVGQVSAFLKEIDERNAERPPTVAVDVKGEVSPGGGFRMSIQPITNFEYRHYCRAVNAELPAHLREGGSGWPVGQRTAAPWMPVTQVSLYDAESYADWLSRRTGRRWRLPTEHEWCLAATAGDKRPYPWGADTPDGTRANFGASYRGPTAVGSFPDGAAATGCLDMGGNVWEWCGDPSPDEQPRRILKGGAYDFNTAGLLVEARHRAIAGSRTAHVGFRVLCEGIAE